MKQRKRKGKSAVPQRSGIVFFLGLSNKIWTPDIRISLGSCQRLLYTTFFRSANQWKRVRGRRTRKPSLQGLIVLITMWRSCPPLLLGHFSTTEYTHLLKEANHTSLMIDWHISLFFFPLLALHSLNGIFRNSSRTISLLLFFSDWNREFIESGFPYRFLGQPTIPEFRLDSSIVQSLLSPFPILSLVVSDQFPLFSDWNMARLWW